MKRKILLFIGCLTAMSPGVFFAQSVVKPSKITENPLVDKAFTCYLEEEYQISDPVPESQMLETWLRNNSHPSYFMIHEDADYYYIDLFLSNISLPHYLITSTGKPIFREYVEISFQKSSQACWDIERILVPLTDITKQIGRSDYKKMLLVTQQMFSEKFSKKKFPNQKPPKKINIYSPKYNPDILEVHIGFVGVNEGEICIGPGCTGLLYFDKAGFELVAAW